MVTLVEILEEALETQALRRLEHGDLTEDEQDRLGQARGLAKDVTVSTTMNTTPSALAMKAPSRLSPTPTNTARTRTQAATLDLPPAAGHPG